MKTTIKNSMTIPYVIEKSNLGERAYDINSRLLEDRIIVIDSEIDSNVSSIVIKELLYLDSISNDPISMYIKSPGGDVYEGLGIIDTMRAINSKIIGIGTGIVASMGSAILSQCDERMCTEYCTIMIHQASSGCRGNIQDIEVNFAETKRLNDILAKMIAKKMGITQEEYLKLTNRDKYLTSEEALKYNLVSKIVPTNKKGELDNE